MENTKISWTVHTFNPWIGCTKVSPGCKHCYAEVLNDQRYGNHNWGPGAPRRTTGDAYWRQPLKWNREAAKTGIRAKVFCASMADVMDDEAPEGARERLWELIRAASSLDWLLLTKRPENFGRFLPWSAGVVPFPNVWLGVSTEDRQRANERIPLLAAFPAVARFLSAEPLLEDLGSIDLRGALIGSSWAVSRAITPGRCNWNGRAH